MGKKYYNPAFDGTWPIVAAATIDGKAYTGTMRIGPAERDGHLIDWKTSAGNYDGIGLVIEGRLFLAFGKKDEGYGLAVYSEVADGIEAVFTSQHFKGAIGIERVAGCKGFDHLDQTYEMQGEQPDDIRYKGKLGFVGYGDLYLATWGFDGTPGQLVGVCMLRHGKLVASYGFRGVYSFGCGCYALMADGTLMGEWGIPTFQTVGKETYGQRSPL